ncbi:MAG: metallophosphoesterase [Candidatus Omnitrophica bacterium]|nr:metallophosphoesterase [Candidatus Omnitrophota bacterium]
MLIRDHPLIFNNFEAVRVEVRAIKKELNIESKSETIPEGFFNDFKTIEIKGNFKVLLLNDIHIPYHDKKSLELAVNKFDKIDIVILNGDIIDCYSLSKFERDPRRRFFKDELETAKKFLSYLRNKFKKSRIIYKFGNHEERFQRFIYYTAPELVGVNEIYLENLLELNNFGIEMYNNKEPIKLGHLYVLHGHEYKGYNNLVSPARGIFLKTKSNTVIGHYHISSTFQDTSISGKFTTCWSVGCLCDLHPEYMPLNRWNLGFAYVETFNEEFNLSNYKIINNKVFST